MIDHYPNDRDYNALCAELREMREQRERLYFRDEALNRPDEIKVKSRKQSEWVDESELTPTNATDIIVTQTPSVQPNDFGYGCFVGLFLSFIAFFILSVLTR